MPRIGKRSRREVLEMLSGRAYRFAFVRHPAKRFESAYWDKMVDNAALAPQDRRRRSGSTSTPTRRSRSSGSWRRSSGRTRCAEMNPHWRPQHVNLMHPVVTYDRVGRLENFDADLAAGERGVRPALGPVRRAQLDQEPARQRLRRPPRPAQPGRGALRDRHGALRLLSVAGAAPTPGRGPGRSPSPAATRSIDCRPALSTISEKSRRRLKIMVSRTTTCFQPRAHRLDRELPVLPREPVGDVAVDVRHLQVRLARREAQRVVACCGRRGSRA